MNTQEVKKDCPNVDKVDVVDLVKNFKPLYGRRPAFACFFNSEGVTYGAFNSSTYAMIYGRQSFLDAGRIAEWSEGLAVICIAHCLKEHQASVVCVLEDDNTWTTHIRFLNTGTNVRWCSSDCWTSIYFAACLAMDENSIKIPIDGLCEMFRPSRLAPRLPKLRKDGSPT